MATALENVQAALKAGGSTVQASAPVVSGAVATAPVSGFQAIAHNYIDAALSMDLHHSDGSAGTDAEKQALREGVQPIIDKAEAANSAVIKVIAVAAGAVLGVGAIGSLGGGLAGSPTGGGAYGSGAGGTAGTSGPGFWSRLLSHFGAR